MGPGFRLSCEKSGSTDTRNKHTETQTPRHIQTHRHIVRHIQTYMHQDTETETQRDRNVETHTNLKNTEAHTHTS